MNILYQKTVLKHNREPSNFGKLDTLTSRFEGRNPLCGDDVQVYMQVEDNKIDKLQFTGRGCAIMTASASIMTETLEGKTLEEAQAQYDNFTEMTKKGEKDLEGELEAFSRIYQFPSRIKCANLPWETLKAALDNNHEEICTE